MSVINTLNQFFEILDVMFWVVSHIDHHSLIFYHVFLSRFSSYVSYRSTGFGFFLSNPALNFKLPINRLIDVVLDVIGGGGGGAYGGGTKREDWYWYYIKVFFIVLTIFSQYLDYQNSL